MSTGVDEEGVSRNEHVPRIASDPSVRMAAARINLGMRSRAWRCLRSLRASVDAGG